MAELKVFLTNLGLYPSELVGEWFSLPYTEEELTSALNRIRIDELNEEYFITDYESSLRNLNVGEYENLSALNELAQLLDDMADIEKLDAVLEYSSCSSVSEVLEMIAEIDNFDLYPEIDSLESLGEYFAEVCDIFANVPEHLQNYFDFERYGSDVYMGSACCFTELGFLMDNR